MLSDEQLMVRAAQGDADAFGELARRHEGWLRRFFYHLMWDHEDAEDACQETLVRVWLARERYRPRAKFTTFLFTVARNLWLHRLQKRSNRPPVVSLHDQLGPEGRAILDRLTAEYDVPEAELLAGYERFRIRRAIDALPEGQRLVFVLAHFEELSYARIAQMLGLPEGTVKSRMWHAYRELRDKLCDEEDRP